MATRTHTPDRAASVSAAVDSLRNALTLPRTHYIEPGEREHECEECPQFQEVIREVLPVLEDALTYVPGLASFKAKRTAAEVDASINETCQQLERRENLKREIVAGMPLPPERVDQPTLLCWRVDGLRITAYLIPGAIHDPLSRT